MEYSQSHSGCLNIYLVTKKNKELATGSVHNCESTVTKYRLYCPKHPFSFQSHDVDILTLAMVYQILRHV